MAALQGAFKIPVTAVNSATVTVIQISAPANQRLKVLGYELSFDGTNSANAPAIVSIERQTGGTFTNTAVAPAKVNDPTGTGETLQASSKNTMTVAPTSGDVLHYHTVPVFGGLLIYPQSPGQEDLIYGGSILGIKVTTTSTVNCYGTVRYEE
jgi:hypothetical protein